MENIKIYCLKDPTTNIIKYVGKTKKSLEKRLNAHIYDRCSTHQSNILKSKWIIDLISKNTRPVIELLEEKRVNTSREEYLLEAFWVNKFENLLNKELVYPKRAIYQYDVFGVFVARYNNILEIAKTYNLAEYQVSNILKTLNNERKLVLDFQWSFEEKEHFPYLKEVTATGIVRKINAATKEVHQYDLQGNYIKSYKSARDAIGFSYRNISQVCVGEKKTHLGFRFSYDKIEKLSPLVKKVRKETKCKKVGKYSLEGVLLKEYEGVKYIDDMKVDSGSISRACNFNKTAYKHKWRYIE